jgi:hypothetical protein
VGHMKNRMEQQDAQGWNFTEGWVCENCVNDYALKAEIESASEDENECTFCGSSPAADLDVLLEAFMDGIWSEYGDANDEGVMYESREGGYLWHKKWDTYELLDDFWDVLTGDGLLEAVKESIHDRVWVERNFAWPRQDEALSASWERFCYAVKHETRYVFWLMRDPDEDSANYTGEVPASRILYELGKLLMDFDLVVVLPAGYRSWRARTHKEESVTWGAADLGTVPVEKAKEANRMSPPGISLFYGSEDADTAIAEVTQRKKDPWVTAGLFETSAPCTVVDFTNLPEVPSLFDSRNHHRRRPLMFLHGFAEDVRRPARETWEQLDYVPTQVMTEYLLKVFMNGEVVSGIQYRSALTGQVSVALEVPNSACVPKADGWSAADHLRLGLNTDSVATRKNPSL